MCDLTGKITAERTCVVREVRGVIGGACQRHHTTYREIKLAVGRTDENGVFQGRNLYPVDKRSPTG